VLALKEAHDSPAVVSASLRMVLVVEPDGFSKDQEGITHAMARSTANDWHAEAKAAPVWFKGIHPRVPIVPNGHRQPAVVFPIVVVMESGVAGVRRQPVNPEVSVKEFADLLRCLALIHASPFTVEVTLR
jgi:hypothetical protein